MRLPIFLSIIELFLYFALGSTAAAFKAIKKEEISRWSNFIIKYIYSIYIFQTMISGFELSQLKELWPLPIIAIAMMLIGALASIPLKFGLKQSTAPLVKSFTNICAMNNFGFLPVIIVGRLWGNEGLSQLFIMLLGSYIGYWTIGVLLFGGRDLKDILKKVFNPSTVAILMGLIIKSSGLYKYIPSVFMDFTTKIGTGAVPLILTLIGANLWFSIKLINRKSLHNLIYFTLIRNILLPAIFILILILLPLNTTVFNIAVIVALMPSSTLSSVLSQMYGGDVGFTSQAALITHLVAMITVPAGLLLLNIQI